MESIYLAAAIALATGVVFALSNHVQHIGLDYIDVRSGTLVNVATTAVILWLLAPLFLAPVSLTSPSAGWFALAGLIVPSLSMTLQTLGVRMIGPGLTAGIASTSPVFAMMIAVAVLGEVVTGPNVAGTALVVGSIAFIAMRSRGTGASWPVWAVIIPLGAALARGLSHNLVKLGLTDLPSPLTATLVASTTSLAVLLVVQLASGRRLPSWSAGYPWFALTGLLNGTGLLGLNVALAFGDVVVVAPLVATVPAFTILLGWLFFKREVVTWSSAGAIALIFVGCVLVILR
jgi:DME family drug/metabolite transporter